MERNVKTMSKRENQEKRERQEKRGVKNRSRSRRDTRKRLGQERNSTWIWGRKGE